METMKALFDTNILVDYLNGAPSAREELARYSARLISLLTWMEVLVGCREPGEETTARRFLESFEVIPVDARVAERAVALRRHNRIRLPDAIIWASAQEQNALLVTRNTKDFPAEAPEIRIPYQL